MNTSLPLSRIPRSESMLAKANAAYLATRAAEASKADEAFVGHTFLVEHVLALTALLDVA